MSPIHGKFETRSIQGNQGKPSRPDEDDEGNGKSRGTGGGEVLARCGAMVRKKRSRHYSQIVSCPNQGPGKTISQTNGGGGEG